MALFRNFKSPCFVFDCGLIDYKACWDLQHRVQQSIMTGRLSNVLLLLEHPPVFTIGRRGDRSNILIEEQRLCSKGIPFFHIERGGDITYHGPGQLVGYPIFRLKGSAFKVVDFVTGLEEVMLRTLEDYGIQGKRSPRNRGVWVEEEKIGSVGIAVSMGISIHGLALNVNTDLSPFNLINPCGLKNIKVTSMEKVLGQEIMISEVKDVMSNHFIEIFRLSSQRKSLSSLRDLLK